MDNKLQKHVSEMKNMAKLLIPYTFPIVSYEDEQDIMILKQRTITVDGYEIVVAMSQGDYNKYHLLTFQVQSGTSPFLPFNLVCKLAKAFLGSKHLSYVEFLRGGRKIYCWTLRLSPEGKHLLPSKETETSVYEGFEYNVLNPNDAT